MRYFLGSRNDQIDEPIQGVSNMTGVEVPPSLFDEFQFVREAEDEFSQPFIQLGKVSQMLRKD